MFVPVFFVCDCVCNDVPLHMLTTSCLLFIDYRGAHVNVFFMFTEVSNVFSVEPMPGGCVLADEVDAPTSSEDVKKSPTGKEES